jgi:hypothetical protein
MNLKLEDWTSLASLGLAVMFVALLLSFYNFLIGPEGIGPERVVEPGSLLLQLIFISAAPCLILAGFVFVMAKTWGSPIGGALLIAAGIIIVAGMAIGVTMVPKSRTLHIFASWRRCNWNRRLHSCCIKKKAHPQQRLR